MKINVNSNNDITVLPLQPTNQNRETSPITRWFSRSFAMGEGINASGLLTEVAANAIAKGTIPNLEKVCRDLFKTFSAHNGSYNATQFLPVLQQVVFNDPKIFRRFRRGEEKSYILVQNRFMKVVLIRWEPGKFSSIHGHANGGCVYKVLQGELEERRYEPREEGKLLAVCRYQAGSMAYLDDTMAYHSVGNPSDAYAFSLHAYTPGLV